MKQALTQLIDVMRWDCGRHPYSNPRRPIRKQIRERRRQDIRLQLFAVIVRAEINRIIAQPFKQRQGNGRHPAFCVTHGRRVIAIDVAEVPLSIDQRIPTGEILCEPYHRIVD